MKFFHYVNDRINLYNKNLTLSFPFKIIKEVSAINSIPNLTNGLKKIAVIADSYIMKTFAYNLNLGNKDTKKIIFNGECSPEEFYRLKNILLNYKCECIVAFGGGKTMDVAKLLKRDLQNIVLILVPTSASTCAAVTSVSVMYDKNGVYMSTVDSSSPDFVIIDYEIFYKLPLSFYAAGIADTMAKYFEIKICLKFQKIKDIYDEFVYEFSKFIYLKLKKIIENFNNMDEQTKEEITDINILFSGLISIIGKYSVTVSAAHTIAHSMTIEKNAQKFLHGELVGFGILMQEKVLGNKKNVNELSYIFSILDIPVKISQFGILKENIENIYKFFCKIRNSEKILFPKENKIMYNNLKKNF